MSRQGAAVQLGSRVASGKPTLIAVWASWCPPCVAEAPYLDKARKDLGKSYNFLYINRREGNPDPDQPADQVAQFLDRAGLSDVDYLVADVRAYQQIVGADFKDIPQGKVGIPRLYLFDAEGRQVYTSYGFDEAEGAQLEQRIKRAMTK
ncbi:TlpA family protein disulfide reductase [Sphingomonas sp. GlSt437]